MEYNEFKADVELKCRNLDFEYCQSRKENYPERWDKDRTARLKKFGFEPMDSLTGEWIGIKPI
jgi:hypothetical protein